MEERNVAEPEPANRGILGKVFAYRPALAKTLATGSVWQAYPEWHMAKMRKGPCLKGPDS